MLKNIGFLINKHNIFLLDYILGNYGKIWIEIGSGNGEFITEIAERENDTLFIACEIKFKRIFKALKRVTRKNLKNVLLVHGGGDILTEFLIKNSSVDKFILNFPDPWFKKRHKKRRIINSSFYKVMYEKLKPYGKIYIATDYSEYAEKIKEEANALAIFKKVNFSEKWLYKNIYTKFEKNFIMEGKKIYYLELTKI